MDYEPPRPLIISRWCLKTGFEPANAEGTTIPWNKPDWLPTSPHSVSFGDAGPIHGKS
jgi:hypothetical protein